MACICACICMWTHFWTSLHTVCPEYNWGTTSKYRKPATAVSDMRFLPILLSTKTYPIISRASISQETARNKVSNFAHSVWSRRDLCHAQQTQLRDCLQWGQLSMQCSLVFASTSSIYSTGNHGGGTEEGGEMEHEPLTHPLPLEPQPEPGKCCGNSQFRCSLPWSILVYFHKSGQILEWDLADIFIVLLVMTFHSKCAKPSQD